MLAIGGTEEGKNTSGLFFYRKTQSRFRVVFTRECHVIGFRSKLWGTGHAMCMNFVVCTYYFVFVHVSFDTYFNFTAEQPLYLVNTTHTADHALLFVLNSWPREPGMLPRAIQLGRRSQKSSLNGGDHPATFYIEMPLL